MVTIPTEAEMLYSIINRYGTRALLEKDIEHTKMHIKKCRDNGDDNDMFLFECTAILQLKALNIYPEGE